MRLELAALHPRVVVFFLMLGGDMSNGETAFEVLGEHYGVSVIWENIFTPTPPNKDGQ